MKRRMLSFMLVLAMILSLVPASALAVDNEDTIRYVSLGASNTNGYGIRGYLPAAVTEDPLAADKTTLNVYGYQMAPEAAYPAQIAKELEKLTGKTVKLDQLAISSMRVEEVRYLLDETYPADEYMNWRFTGGQKWFEVAEKGGVAKLREAYQTALAEADYITMDIGWNNFGVYAFNNIKVIMADGRYWKAPEFDQSMSAQTQLKYEELKAYVMEELTGSADAADGSLLAKLEMMADILVYTTIGACYHFDVIMDKIYAKNDDANVVVLSIQNLAEGLNIEFEGLSLPIGDIYGKLIDVVNMYRASVSRHSEKYVYADPGVNGYVTTFLDEILAWNGDPTTLSGNMLDCFDMYDDNLYVRSIIEYLMVTQGLHEIFKAVNSASSGLLFAGDKYDLTLPMTKEQLLSVDLTNPPAQIKGFIAKAYQPLQYIRNKNFTAYDSYIADTLAPVVALGMVKEADVAALQAAVRTNLEGLYKAYQFTLNNAYATVATIVKAAAEIDTIQLGADSLSNANAAEDKLMGYIFNEAVGGAEVNFMYAMGLAPAPYEFKMDESLLADPAVAAVAVLAVRYELGNSFYAHPNEKGHDEITEAVMYALENNVSGDEFTKGKLANIIDLIDRIIKAKDEAAEAIRQQLADAIAGITTEDLLAGYGVAKAILGEAYAELKGDFGYAYGEEDYFVALGDANAYGPAVKLLAAELDVNYADLTAAGVTAAELLENLADYTDEIAKADLITLGFDPNAFMSFAGKQVMAAVLGSDLAEMDWAALVGEDVAGMIAATMEKLGDEIAVGGVPAEYAAVVSVLVESYAYAYVSHLLNSVKLNNRIRAINGDAVLALVGMHNPLDGLVLELDGEELDLGEYVAYIVDLANTCALGYAVYEPNTVYADAWDVETAFAGKTVGAVNFVMELMSFDKNAAKYLPTEAGYAYIAQQIYAALNPTAIEDAPGGEGEEVVPHVHGAPKDDTVKFTWTADHKACVAEYVCSGCGEKLTAKCAVKSETKQPTVEAEGYVKNTASVEIAGVTYYNTQREVLAKLPAPVVPEKPEVPETGDNTMIGLYVAVMVVAVVAAAAVVVVLKKKKNN